MKKRAIARDFYDLMGIVLMWNVLHMFSSLSTHHLESCHESAGIHRIDHCRYHLLPQKGKGTS